MFCDRCGTPLPPSASACPSCSHPVPRPEQFARAAPNQPFEASGANPNASASDWLGEGWRIITSDFWTFALLGVLYLVISSAVPIILQGPLTIGLQWAIYRRMVQGRTEINDLFYGFQFFVPAMVTALLTSIFVTTGVIFCIIPGLLVAAVLQFPYLLIADRGMDFWPAMETSYRISQARLGRFTGFVLLQILVLTGGFLLCVVGIVIAVPWVHAATVVAYRDVIGFRSQPQRTP